MKEELRKAEEILKKYNQEHVIKFIKNEDEQKQKELIEQILLLDFDEISSLYKQKELTNVTDSNNWKPINSLNPDKFSEKDLEEYIEEGKEIFKNSKYAVVTMAGGQGTRLNHNFAKGTYKIAIGDKGKYLFEILADSIKRENEKYNVTIPWYIMTSKENYLYTVNFFEENNFFGYPKEDICFFAQRQIVMLDMNGKVIIDENGLIKMAANGNGGVFKLMKEKKIIEDMKRRGIEWIFIGSVDNILLKVADPLLVGFTSKNSTLIGTKTVLKSNPFEKVGVFCKQNGKIRVIEYTELPKKIAQKTNDEGELIFGESHIMCNLFNIKALDIISEKELKYHVAIKKASYLNKEGELIEPTEPNSYKFEKFIFDSFNLFQDISILRGKREIDFAPVKNKTGEDSPETAIKLYENYWNMNNTTAVQ